MSIRCSKCACMAMATPIAPSTIATRQIRLKIAVELSSPWLNAGLPSRKSITCASGSASSTCLRMATGSEAIPAFSPAPLFSGNFSSSRWLARLPGAISPVSFRAACEIITLGPSPAPAVSRSGSCFKTAAILKFRPPNRSDCPTCAFSRMRNSSATTTESPARACSRVIAGSNSASP